MKITKPIAHKIWDVLVKHAGASGLLSERNCFVYSFCEDKHPPTEYRFCGSLGFGGKFWNNNAFYVTCYKEDETPDKTKIILEVNRLLALIELEIP